MFAVDDIVQINPWAQFGLVGVVCGVLIASVLWFMRHLLTTTLPTMMNTFVTELASERTSRSTELANERGARAVQHADNREDHQRMVTAVEMAKREVLERVEKEMSDLRQELKDTRHAVKNQNAALLQLVEVTRHMRSQESKERKSQKQSSDEESK